MQLPIGILSNTAAILCGGLLGAVLGKYIPPRVQAALTTVFGLCSIAIGITLVVQIYALPTVVLSCILGTLLGEAANLQLRLEGLTDRMQNGLARFMPKEGARDEAFTGKFISILVLFCMSGTGILGAMTEGFTGDATILLTKSIMDFFTAIIFAASLGASVSLIALPEFLFFMLLFLLSGAIMPLVMPSMISDFKACGGILSIAVGLRLTEIKPIQVVNMLPSLILVMPVSYIWEVFFKERQTAYMLRMSGRFATHSAARSRCVGRRLPPCTPCLTGSPPSSLCHRQRSGSILHPSIAYAICL